MAARRPHRECGGLERRPSVPARPGKSIAVLPFANLSPDPENEVLSDGLTDEVTADLSRLGTLRVISRTSSMAFKSTSKDAGTIARELGVMIHPRR